MSIKLILYFVEIYKIFQYKLFKTSRRNTIYGVIINSQTLYIVKIGLAFFAKSDIVNISSNDRREKYALSFL